MTEQLDELDDFPAIEGEIVDEEETGTPEAPYGYTPTGRIRKRPIGSRAGTTTRTSTRGLSNDFIADKIVEYISVPVSPFSPLAAAVIDDRATRVADALLVLAGQSPRFAKALKKALSVAAYGEFVMFPLAITTALLVEFGRLAPTAFAAEKFHITEFYIRMYGTQGIENLTNGHRPGPHSGLIPEE